MTVIAFPAARRTADVLDRARPEAIACVGDLILLCVSTARDLWVAWPITAVNDAGVAMTVLNKAGGEWPVLLLNQGERCIVCPSSRFEPEQFLAMRWRAFEGLEAASNAFREIHLDAGTPAA